MGTRYWRRLPPQIFQAAALFPSITSSPQRLVHSSGDSHRLSCSPPQAALQAAAHASVDIKNVLDFYKQWKEIG